MITSFRHKGLRQFYETGSKAGIQAQQAGRLRLILARLDAAREPRDMNLPGLRLHSMSGDLAGFWSVSCEWELEGDLSFQRPRRLRRRLPGLPLKKRSNNYDAQSSTSRRSHSRAMP
nr:type II toxin-antitoxin system RelE/ParE family toxin [Desulfuromonas sp. TF]